MVPELKQAKPQLYKTVLADMHKDKFRGNEEEARMEFEKRVKPVVCLETFRGYSIGLTSPS